LVYELSFNIFVSINTFSAMNLVSPTRHTYTRDALILSSLVSSKLKKRFEGIISAGVKPFADAGVTPNMVTFLGLLVSFASAWFYYSWTSSPLLLPAAGLLILLSGLFDALDGVIARTTGKVTAFGGFFDSVSDRYADAFVLAGITLGGLCNPIAGFASLIGSLMVSYTRSRAEAAGVAMAGVGFAERAERMVILAAVTFIAVWWIDALNYGVILLAILSHLTVLQRVQHFRRNAK
jgi:archaetidylinositol phosphate synthase